MIIWENFKKLMRLRFQNNSKLAKKSNLGYNYLIY